VKAAIVDAAKRVQEAEEALARAKEAHEREFRVALVELYNSYGLSVEANGCEGCRLEIHEISHKFTLEMLDY
jgi:hypothetical protein